MSDAYKESSKGQAARVPPCPPTSGPEVIDCLFPLTIAAAQPLDLDSRCIDYMHTARGESGRSNDESFRECFDRGSYNRAEPELRRAAARHGVFAKLIQMELDPQSRIVTLDAFIAAGAAVRQLCHASCGKGQWCDWP